MFFAVLQYTSIIWFHFPGVLGGGLYVKKTWIIFFHHYYINNIFLYSVMLLSIYTYIAYMSLMFISVLNLIICKSTSVAN